MSDRRNRRILGFIGLLLAAGGVLSTCLGAGAFGNSRSNRTVFDNTIVRWWDEGGWMSFAVVTAIGVLAFVLGVMLVFSQLRRNDGLRRTPTITFEPADGQRGETTLRSPALSHSVESDLESVPDIHKALVGLFGHHPEVELRAVLEVGDSVDLEQLPHRVDEVLGRLETTTGVRPDKVQVTVRFKDADKERQLA